MGRRLNKVRDAAGLILKFRIIVAVQDLKISLYMQILVPTTLTSAPLFRLLGRRHCTEHTEYALVFLVRNLVSCFFCR